MAVVRVGMVFVGALVALAVSACGGVLAVDDLQLEPKIADFGRVPVGEGAEMTIRLSNSGEGVLENLGLLVDAEIGQPLGFEIVGPELDGPLTLGPGETFDVQVRFVPQEERDYVGYLFGFTPRQDDPGENAYLVGRGVSPPVPRPSGDGGM